MQRQQSAVRRWKSEKTTVRVYEVRSRKDRRGVDLISDVLPFSRLWYDGPKAISNAVDYAQFYSRSHHAVVRVYDEFGDVIRQSACGSSDMNEPQLQLGSFA